MVEVVVVERVKVVVEEGVHPGEIWIRDVDLINSSPRSVNPKCECQRVGGMHV